MMGWIRENWVTLKERLNPQQNNSHHPTSHYKCLICVIMEEKKDIVYNIFMFNLWWNNDNIE